MPSIIEIDGSFGTGGGAILRVATALSVLTQKPIRIFNIRAGRKQPGLKTQHLEGLKATAELCSGKLKGAALSSTEIEFVPRQIIKEKIDINVATAGAVGLILQVLQLACVHAPHPINISIRGGGTFGKWAPPTPFLQNITLALLEKIGYKIDIKTLRHGFYPVGGGETEIKIWPAKELKPINLVEQGTIERIAGVSIAARQLEKNKVADRQAKAASEILLKELGIKPAIDVKYVDATCPGSGIVLWLKTSTGVILGSDAIGELGVTSEKIGESAAKQLVEDWRNAGCVDRHAADQLVPFMALAGDSAVKVPLITPHTRTNIWVTEKFLPVRFEIDEKSRIISCKSRS